MSKIEQNFGETEQIINESREKQEKLSIEKLQGLNNNDFLKIPEENRLEYITMNKISSNDLLKNNLRIQNIEFNFTFKGEFNRQLWLKTTAGQVLPKEVGKVESNGITYIRNNLKGEFFALNGSRLIINQGTKLEIKELRYISLLEENNNKKIEEYLKKDKKYIENQDILKEAINRGVDVEYALSKFKNILNKYPLLSLERKSILEDLFTNLDRIKGNKNRVSTLSEIQKNEIISKAPEKVKYLVKKYFPESEYENALLVCYGESGFKERAYNKNTDKYSSIDRGLFQINDYYHSNKYIGQNIYNPEVNVRIAYKIFKEAGYSWKPWYAAQKIGLA